MPISCSYTSGSKLSRNDIFNPRLILTAGAAGNTYTTAQGLMKLMDPNLAGSGGTPTNIVTIPWELKSTRLSLDLQKQVRLVGARYLHNAEFNKW